MTVDRRDLCCISAGQVCMRNTLFVLLYVAMQNVYNQFSECVCSWQLCLHFLPERHYVTLGYMPSQISLSPVTFVPPTQLVEIFRHVSMLFCTLAIRWPPLKFFYGDHPRETPPLGLNAIGIAKYSNIGHVDDYISEMVQNTASGTIND